MGHSTGSVFLPKNSPEMLRFKLGAVLLIALAACGAQFVGAMLTSSIALLAESVHMLVDLIGLSIAFGVALMPRSASSTRRRRFEAISALVQSTLLIGVGIYAALRGIRALIMPHPLAGDFILIFAAAGLVANIVCGAILYSSRSANLNFRAAFLEVVSDALGSLAVISAGLAMIFFGFYQADAIAALALAFLMVPRGIRILRIALAELFPARKLGATIVALAISVCFSLGVSQLHQLVAPSQLHLPQPTADSYSWNSKSEPELKLSFDAEAGIATLADSCGSAASAYERTYGGVFFQQFVNLDPRCEDSELSKFLEVDSAYFGENFESLKLLAGPEVELIELSATQRIADQQTADSWRPFLELLFRL